MKLAKITAVIFLIGILSSCTSQPKDMNLDGYVDVDFEEQE